MLPPRATPSHMRLASLPSSLHHLATRPVNCQPSLPVSWQKRHVLPPIALRNPVNASRDVAACASAIQAGKEFPAASTVVGRTAPLGCTCVPATCSSGAARAPPLPLPDIRHSPTLHPPVAGQTILRAVRCLQTSTSRWPGPLRLRTPQNFAPHEIGMSAPGTLRTANLLRCSWARLSPVGRTIGKSAAESL